MAWIFNLIALFNFTTTCQCHFWSTISVDGFTSQVACTWMIQMTLNGISQKQKIGHLMGHYMIPHHVLHIFSLRRGSHREIFQSVCNARKRRCVLGQNLKGYALKCTLYPNICNKSPENYTQIYAVRKLVPKCAYLSRTEIRLTRVTIVC